MSLPHLILGLLSDQPMSGYDLNKAFTQSVSHFWTVDQSQIYRALHKLNNGGQLRVEHIEQSDNPDKKVYHVTPQGEQMLEDWLKAPYTEPPVREGWLGQIYFADHVSDQKLIENLRLYRDDFEVRYNILKALKANILSQIDDPDHLPRRWRLRLITLDYGIDVHAFHLDWFNRTIARIQQNSDQL